MKKVLFILAVLLLVPFCFAAPTIQNYTATTTKYAVTLAWDTVNPANYSLKFFSDSARTVNIFNATSGTLLNHTTYTYGGLVPATTYYANLTAYNLTGGTATDNTMSFTTDDDDILIESDTADGLPATGTYMGNMLGNLAPGLGKFLLIVGIFGGIVAIIAGLVSVIRKKIKV